MRVPSGMYIACLLVQVAYCSPFSHAARSPASELHTAERAEVRSRRELGRRRFWSIWMRGIWRRACTLNP